MPQIAFPVPDQDIIARRDEIIAGLSRLVAPESLITASDERRAFETDALTSYRRMPLAVVLPRTTEEVSAVLRFCSEQGVFVVARGAGTSLAGGAIPQEDAVVVGISKMSRVLDVDFASRSIRVEAGITNLAVSNAIMAERFFYAPDPSSQLACTIAGNIAMNSGGAHCLKYGVTTNNVLAARMVLIDGTIVDVGSEGLDSPGLDLLGLVIGSEGQLGIVTEATLRILPMAEGARPVLFGFDSSEAAGTAVAAIIGAGIMPVAMEFMDQRPRDIGHLPILSNPSPSPMYQQTVNWFRTDGLSPRQISVSNSITIIAHLVAAGFGVAILPTRMVEADILAGRVVALKSEPTIDDSRMSAAYRTDDWRPTINAVLEASREVIDDLHWLDTPTHITAPVSCA